MKIALLGGNGMAGHVIATQLQREFGHELVVSIRPGAKPNRHLTAIGAEVRETDLSSFMDVEDLIEREAPDAIVNAAGILNEDAEKQPISAFMVNGLLPHWLRHLGKRTGARLLHISTDCVFSGRRGDYRETDATDGTSVYARSKALGEVKDAGHATIRTSIIGPDERAAGIGLMQWFLSRSGEVPGYRNVLWNGVTTLELAKAVAWLLEHPEVNGLLHLTAAEKVAKHDLLLLLQREFGKGDVTVVPDDRIALDRTLVSTRTDFAYRAPGFAAMLAELHGWMRSS